MEKGAEPDEVWLVDPFERTLLVERKDGPAYRRTEHSQGRIESTVVPDFWIDAAWLWQDDLPSTLGCLREILGGL